MTQENKNLLFKDICARLPYKLVCEVKYKEEGKYKKSNMVLSGVFTDEAYFTSGKGSIYSNDYKPYLFPISSMTEDQIEEYAHILVMCGTLESSQLMRMTVEDWFNKNHLDFRGLIPMDLALDASGLNIY
jgi:hypothetical protein